MSITIPYNFKPRSYQLEVLKALDGITGNPNTKKTRAILRWARKAGKDKLCFNYLIKEASQVIGNYYYVFPYITEGRKALWEHIDKQGFRMLDHIPKAAIYSMNNHDMVIVLKKDPNVPLNQSEPGSTIRVIGGDTDPDSIRGVSARGIVFSEYAFSDPNVAKILMPALRETKGWAIYNSTPNGRNHYYELYNRAISSDRWCVSYLQTYWPDQEGYYPLATKEELQLMMDEEGLTEEDMEREMGCSFSTGVTGAYWIKNIELAYTSGRIGDFTFNEDAIVDTFWDIGKADSTAIWFRQRAGNSFLLGDYYENTGQGPNFYINILRDKGYKYGTHFLPHDAASKNFAGCAVDQLIQSALNNNMSANFICLKKVDTKQTSINAVRKRFSKYYFNYLNCKPGLIKLENYKKQYNRLTREYRDIPVHDGNSHAADALQCEAMSEYEDIDIFQRNTKIQVNSDIDWELYKF